MTPTQPISSTHLRTCVQTSNSCKIDIIVLHTSFYQRNKLDRSLWQYICWLLAHFYEKPFRPGSNLNQWPRSVRSHVSCSNISVLSPNSWNKVQVSQNQWIPQSVRLIIPFPTFNEKHKDDTCVNTRCPQFFKKKQNQSKFSLGGRDPIHAVPTFSFWPFPRLMARKLFQSAHRFCPPQINSLRVHTCPVPKILNSKCAPFSLKISLNSTKC